MDEHEVPTHVQAEDRVLLWFTFPQIVALTAVAALAYGTAPFATFRSIPETAVTNDSYSSSARHLAYHPVSGLRNHPLLIHRFDALTQEPYPVRPATGRLKPPAHITVVQPPF